jgi:uncharacterized DUF497 family protein
MKPFDWNSDKNEKLIAERGISFEEVVVALEEGKLLDILSHGNAKKYPGQRVLIVEIQGYACAIPYVEDDDKIFLKTIIPSRKYTKRYL